MLKRTIIFQKAYSLSIKNKQLFCQNLENSEGKIVPIDDIGFLVIENCQTKISIPTLSLLSKNNVAVIFCNEKHLPESMLVSFSGHHLQQQIVNEQLNGKEPLKKQLWKKIITSKITNQYLFTKKINCENKELFNFKSNVSSGDIHNIEGLAAKSYWKTLFTSFRRERNGDFPNNLLDYGYIILRASVARAITGSGLLPVLGIHHHNQYNSFCLADDLMEPYRPYVDEIVYSIVKEDPTSHELNQARKAELLNLLTCDVKIGKVVRPLSLALSQTTASLAKSYQENKILLECPKFQ